MNLKLTTTLSALAIGLSASFSSASVILDNDFEGGTMEDWSATGSDAGLYENGDVVSNMGASDAAINYAPTGDFSLWDGRGSSSLVLTNPLSLDTEGYTQVTIDFNYKFRNASGTRRLYTGYSSDGGLNWTNLGYVTYSGSKTYTLNEGTYTFTDNAKFRFTFSDSGGSAGPAFVDDIVIAGTPDYVPEVPEPASIATGLFGLTLIAGRRRRA
jgi:hypothetical protein